MEIINFSNLESQILSLFNEGQRTFEALNESSSITEKTLSNVIEGLLSKNILKLNPKTHEYEYQSKVDGDIIILDGNLLLPTTIIRTDKMMYISRGEWYEFPLDFDIRRIIWNVKLEHKTNSTLVDLIKSSVLKDKKSKNVQLPEYENLKNKIVPYSKSIGLLLNTIGENATDVTVIFKLKIGENSDIQAEHRGFNVRTEIATEELITQLRTPIESRNFEEGIKLNRLYNFSDFVFSKNEIPISISEKEINYIKITGIRKSLELTYYKMDASGNVIKLDIETFPDSNDGIEKLKDLFRGLPSVILSENNILTEMTE